HENNGNFFWWGQQKRFVELWRQMYDRFTRYHKLDNLLWVYNANHFASSGNDANWVRKNYPGDSLVDVMSLDVYAPYFTFQKHMYDTLMAIGGGKPVGISENGLMPDVPKLFSEGQHYAFWVTWWGFEDAGDQDGLTGNADAMYTTNYGSPYTITEDEIKLDIVSDGKKTVGVTAMVGGAVKAAPAGRVDSGATVTITATAESGYDFAGWTGDTTVSASVNPLVVKVVKDRSIQAKFIPNATTNLVKGGAFNGADSGNWNFYAATGNTASVKYGTGSAVATMGATSKLNYDIQLSQNNITIDSGATYVLSFEASSTVARELNVGLSTAGVWYYRGGGTVELTASKVVYSIEIPVDSSTNVAVLQFNLGSVVGSVTIDNVTLVRKAGTSILPRTIGSSKLSLRSVSGGFEWVRSAPLAGAATVRVVDVQGHELYRSVAKAGAVTGFVPAVGAGLRFVVLEGVAERDV
ncbi:MAG: glycosyl hydrolase, partial [Fibrobacterota bacterium]